MKRLWILAIAAGVVAAAQAADEKSSVDKAEQAVGTAAHKTEKAATDAAHGAQHGMQKGGAAIATEIDKADKAMHGKSGKSAVADVKAQSDPPAATKSTSAAKAASQSK